MDEFSQIEQPERNEVTSPSPQEEMVITDLEVLKAISDPLRIRIVELLIEPHTVKEIAPQLNIGKTKLYYHINLLEKHGIIRVVRTRLVSGILEKSYQITAMRFRPAAELLAGGEEGKEQGIAIFDSIFDVTRADFLRSLKNEDLDSALEKKERRFFLGRTIICLTEEQASAFSERFDALLEELKAYEASTPDSRQYALTMAFFPRAEG